MTLREVSEQCAMPLELLYSELGLPAGTSPLVALKDLQAQFADLDVETVREVVAAYQGR
jgi:hypothetical protein